MRRRVGVAAMSGTVSLAIVGLGLMAPLGSEVRAGAGQGQAKGVAVPRDGPVRLELAQQILKKKSRTKRAMVPMPAGSDAPAKKGEPEPDDPGEGKLRFSRDIAPILVGNCIDCHNPERRRGKFDLTTFQKLIGGSEKGKVIVPGKPEESLLVLHIKGEEDPKMPPGNRNLSAEAIARIESWVKEGARLDAGIEPTASLRSIAPTAEDLRKSKLTKMSPAERDKQLEEVGRERWKKASPKTTPETTSSANFLLFSNLPRDRAARLLKSLEAQHAMVNRILGKPGGSGAGLVEKISVYVFNDANGFVEFSRSVENREVEAGTQAHGNLSVESPFLAAADPLAGREDESLKRKPSRSKKGGEAFSGPERSLDGLLVEQLGTASAQQAGKPPRWLTMGLGAYLGSRVEPRSPYYRRLRQVTFQEYKLGWMTKAQEALGDTTDEEKVRAIGFSLFEWLASTDQARLPILIRSLLNGQEKLDENLMQIWGATREAFLAEWGNWVGTHYAGRR